MFKVSFRVRHCLIPAFNVSDPTVPFIRLPIGSSSSPCYNEHRVYEIGMEGVFALERRDKVFFSFPFFIVCVLIRASLFQSKVKTSTNFQLY